MFHCYAIYHGYQWVVIDISTNITLQKLCPHKNFLFQRHCVTAELMKEMTAEWILFIDADTTVINPNRLIEEWIDKNYNMIFYLRIRFFEITAGVYLARNNPYSRNFLHFWADYEHRLPNSVHNHDNGALHVGHLKCLIFSKKKFVWKSRYEDVSSYEACIQYLLGPKKSWPGKIKILGKPKGMTRDAPITKSLWGRRDFLIHGWKKKLIGSAWLGKNPFYPHNFDINLCSTNNVMLNWPYKPQMFKTDKKIEKILNRTIKFVNRRYDRRVKILVLKALGVRDERKSLHTTHLLYV
ncbi:unnamed protein product [Enterobius vermicularis]|uniref:Nucleotide-diphospho-sugar transferase domain-containing protein n=1 Tax=Enterobius vermicularis TaxID=51028 RepID=A0A3P6IR30_ENTVE|nr:unnamed protein product [Enterobius vermicularis]